MPKVHFNPAKDIPSLEGKVILVTGGNAGLGKQTILQLAKHKPAAIWLGARSVQKAQEAIDEIRKQVPNAPIKILEMDLTSFASIRAAAKSFREQSERLDILILNAGIMMVPHDTTKDGYEVQFGTNHMGHALLNKLLLPTLLHTAELPGAEVRVVILSSSAHSMADKGIDFDSVKSNGQKHNNRVLYGQSKLANILYTQEFARRYPQFMVPTVHPGIVHTNLATTVSNSSFMMRIMSKLVLGAVAVDVETGALNQLWAAVGSDVKSGEYYEPVGLTGKGNNWTKDKALAKKVWEWTEKELEGQLE